MATSSFRVSSQILAVASSLALVSIVEIAPLTGVKSALLFSLLLLSIAVGAYRARHLLRAAPAKWLIPITVAASVIACLAFAFLTEERSPLMTFAWALAPTLTGWSILFWLIHSSDEQASIATWEPPRWSLPALLVATAVVLAIVHQLAVGRWTIVSDEVFYVMQSAWIRQPGYSWHVDPEIAPFFLMRKTGLSPDGGIIGMYTPGWPALLALFNAIGLRWWSGVILGTGSVYLTYRIGEALHSRRVGILAALLLATNPIFQLVHPGYVSHPAMIFLLALATLMLIQAEKADGRGRIVRWLAAGFLLSLALITRTLTGGAFTLSFAMWMLLRGRMNFSLMMRCALAVGVGALPLVLWFLHYNEVTSGAAFKLSYQA
ncbi:MAG: glycosyltransferase family 39 protein, partial [Gemmatimonadaceae bacterium]